jgi:hypothetical protein
MSQPDPFPGPAGEPARGRGRPPLAGRAALLACLAVIAGTALLGVAAGFGWAAAAPRAVLVMTGPGMAGLVNAETSAFIAADGIFCLICVAGGVVTGVLAYAFAVRRHGPLPMAATFAGALAAAFLARWTGEQSGLATFHHLLATLPAGAHLRNSLTLGAGSALACWPLASGTVAGALVAFGAPAGPPPGVAEPVLAGQGPDLPPSAASAAPGG